MGSAGSAVLLALWGPPAQWGPPALSGPPGPSRPAASIGPIRSAGPTGPKGCRLHLPADGLGDPGRSGAL